MNSQNCGRKVQGLNGDTRQLRGFVVEFVTDKSAFDKWGLAVYIRLSWLEKQTLLESSYCHTMDYPGWRY